MEWNKKLNLIYIEDHQARRGIRKSIFDIISIFVVVDLRSQGILRSTCEDDISIVRGRAYGVPAP